MDRNSNAEHAQEILTLADAHVHGNLSADMAQRLERLVLEDAEARQLYVEYLQDSYHLHSLAAHALAADDEQQRGAEEVTGDQWPVISESATPCPAFPSTICYPLSTPYSFVGSPLFSYLVAAVILGIGLLIGAVTHVSQTVQVVQKTPSPALGRGAGDEGSVAGDNVRSTVVGQITGTVDCEFAASSKTKDQRPKTAVSFGDKFTLVSGLLEITYNTGAKVILQGPVTYEVESPAGGFLSVGRLTASVADSKTKDRRPKTKVPHPSSLIPHPLFVVRTPTALVTDLGTEFGVEVSKEGNTTSRVFRGSVRLQAVARDNAVSSPAMILHENESAQVEKNAGQVAKVRRVPVDQCAFVRRLVAPPKVIDLLDIVAGGSGLGHGRERGIDPILGLECTAFESEPRSSDRKYHRAVYFSMIDGVFVPSGGQGPVVLDSAGHAFEGFPRTSGKTDCPIWARAARVKKNDLANDKRYWVYWTGANEKYTPEGRGLLAFHANAGITFDLAAIQKRIRGVHPTRLRACVGPADDRGQYPQAKHWASLWVFVDGRLAMKQLDIHPKNAPVPVDVPLNPDDRFLTLAVTDSNRGVDDFAWLFVGDPVLDAIPEP
jgi:hypothetical protein